MGVLKEIQRGVMMVVGLLVRVIEEEKITIIIISVFEGMMREMVGWGENHGLQDHDWWIDR